MSLHAALPQERSVMKGVVAMPNDAEEYYKRGNFYSLKGEYDLAVTNYTEAIRLQPDNTEAYYKRGNVYSLTGVYDLAIADYTEAIRLRPKSATAYYNGRPRDRRWMSRNENMTSGTSNRLHTSGP